MLSPPETGSFDKEKAPARRNGICIITGERPGGPAFHMFLIIRSCPGTDNSKRARTGVHHILFEKSDSRKGVMEAENETTDRTGCSLPVWDHEPKDGERIPNPILENAVEKRYTNLNYVIMCRKSRKEAIGRRQNG